MQEAPNEITFSNIIAVTFHTVSLMYKDYNRIINIIKRNIPKIRNAKNVSMTRPKIINHSKFQKFVKP